MITREQIEKTTAEWESQNPTLAADVIGIEITSTGYLRYKRGNGSSVWSELSYLDKIPPSVGGGGSIDLESATGVLPVSKGGTGLTTLTDGSFLVGNGTADVELMTPANALTAIGAQKKMAFATASTLTSAVTGTKDIDLQTFVEGGDASVFSNARYSSSYGYGIKVAKAGKYLVSATLNLQNDSNSTTAGSTVTAAIRKVVGGTSTYIAKTNHTFLANSYGSAVAMVFSPRLFSLEANAYLSLYNSLSTVRTKAEGCWLTVVYLGE